MLNTVIALLGAVLAAFTASAACGKLDMVHIQNATLAGGVALDQAPTWQCPPRAPSPVGAPGRSWQLQAAWRQDGVLCGDACWTR